MLHLIYKDFYVNKKYFLLLLLISAIIAFTEQVAGMVLPIIMITYGMLASSCYNDDLGKGDVLLRSLPIKAHHIVYGKYLFGILVAVIAFLPYIILALIQNTKYFSDINFSTMAILFFAVSFMISIYLPVFFRYGYMKARTFQTLFYVGIALSSLAISSSINTLKATIPPSRVEGFLKPLNSAMQWVIESGQGIFLWLMMISGILLLLSAFISVKLYDVGRP